MNTRQANIKSFFSDQDGRVICVDIEIGGVVLHIINTYFPNVDAEQYSLLHNLHPFFHSSHPIIWAGDHNISTNNEIDRLPPKNNKDRYGDSILEIISNFDLVDTCRAVYPNETNLFTYTQGLSKSRIDKIIVQREFKVVKYQQEMIYHSDHELLISQIHLNDDFERGKGVWKNNSLLYQNQYFLDEFKLLWNAWRRTSGVHCPVRRWVQLKNHVKSFLIDVGKKYAYQKKQKKKNDYDQLNYYLNCARCNVGSQRVNFMKQYSELKKTLAKAEIQEIKQNIELKKCKELLEGDKPVKCFFQKFRKSDFKANKIKTLVDKDGIYKERLADMLSFASDFYKDLYNDDNIMLIYLRP